MISWRSWKFEGSAKSRMVLGGLDFSGRPRIVCRVGGHFFPWRRCWSVGLYEILIASRVRAGGAILLLTAHFIQTPTYLRVVSSFICGACTEANGFSKLL